MVFMVKSYDFLYNYNTNISSYLGGLKLMDKGLFYCVEGEHSFPDLPIDLLVDMEELIHFKKINPLEHSRHIPIYSSIDIESVAVEIYKEYLLAKEFIKRQHGFKIQQFPYLNQKKEYYFLKNEELLKNTIIQRFIEDDLNLNVLVLSLFWEKDCKDLLDQLFREFYFEYRFIAYISQLLYFEAVNYDKTKRKDEERQRVILDQPINQEENITLIDKFTSSESIKDEVNEGEFQNSLANEVLFKAFGDLTKKQQQILYLAYVEELKDVEIAKKLNVSQQAVSKTRKNALMILRKSLEVRK